MVVLEPAPADTGIVFLTPRGEIRAAVENVSAVTRCTCLRSGNAEISTVEHLLAALFGMRVDNAYVRVDGPEIPAGDGSALPFVELIEQVGLEPQPGEPRIVPIEQPVWAIDGDKCILAVPSPGFTVSALVSFDHPMIGEQAVSVCVNPEVFKSEIAPARTFCTAEEIESLLEAGLGRGGNADNVLVVHRDHYAPDLRFRNEIARHKVLDMIGDLSLAGGTISADVTGIRPSHALNVALVRQLIVQLSK
jgi:UDP-3-O-[3-hydroxymyristoyl] N-acetylglucosamine deacetylase